MAIVGGAALLHKLKFDRTSPYLSCRLCDRHAKGGVAVQHRNPDLELSELSVKVLGHEALAKWHAEQHLHRETNLDCRTAELALTTALAGRMGMPFHLGIKRDR